MTYKFKFFKCEHEQEKFELEQNFTVKPFLPRQGDFVVLNEKPYEVLRISHGFPLEEDAEGFVDLIEIAVRPIDEYREWWER